MMTPEEIDKAPAAPAPKPSQPPAPATAPEWWPKGAAWPPEWDELYDYDEQPQAPLPRADAPRPPPPPAQAAKSDDGCGGLHDGTAFASVFTDAFKWMNDAPPVMRSGLSALASAFNRAISGILGIKTGSERDGEDCAIILERGDDEVVEIRRKFTSLNELADTAKRVVSALHTPDCFGFWLPPPGATTEPTWSVGVAAHPVDPHAAPPPGADPYGPDVPPSKRTGLGGTQEDPLP